MQQENNIQKQPLTEKKNPAKQVNADDTHSLYSGYFRDLTVMIDLGNQLGEISTCCTKLTMNSGTGKSKKSQKIILSKDSEYM